MASGQSFRLHYKQCHFKPKKVAWYDIGEHHRSQHGHTTESLVWLVHQRDLAGLPVTDIQGAYLRVVIKKATNLVNMDVGFNTSGGINRSDPYAVCHLGGVTERTRTINDDLNPVWNKKFYFPCGTQDVLYIDIFDDDGIEVKDDFLGHVEIPVESVIRAGGILNKAFPLAMDGAEGSKLFLELEHVEPSRNKNLPDKISSWRSKANEPPEQVSSASGVIPVV